VKLLAPKLARKDLLGARKRCGIFVSDAAAPDLAEAVHVADLETSISSP